MGLHEQVASISWSKVIVFFMQLTVYLVPTLHSFLGKCSGYTEIWYPLFVLWCERWCRHLDNSVRHYIIKWQMNWIGNKWLRNSNEGEIILGRKIKWESIKLNWAMRHLGYKGTMWNAFQDCRCHVIIQK